MKQSFLPPKILRDGKLILQFIILAGGDLLFYCLFQREYDFPNSLSSLIFYSCF